MANWRDDDAGKKPRKQPTLKSPRPISSEIHASGKTSADDWRPKSGTAASPKPAGTAKSRTWLQGLEEDEPVDASGLKRWIAVGILGSVTLLLTFWLFIIEFRRPPRLPLFVVSVGPYDSPEMIENPFGESQRDKLRTVNEDSVTSYVEVNQKNNDNALSEFQNAEWTQTFDGVNKTPLTGGGPDGEVVAFYVSAYARRIDGSLYLYPQGAAPFMPLQSSGAIRLQDVLQNIARSVEDSNIAWVTLDLQFPPVLSNLADLDIPWRTAVESTVLELDQALKERLLVTLPCDDGQLNWIAPEFSSSFFGYYYHQLLEGRFAERSNLLDTSLTIAEFKGLLDSKVKNIVTNRRYALQEPVWLPQENLERCSSVRLVTVSDGDLTPPEPSMVSQQNLKSIDEWWLKLNGGDFRNAFRWDPLGYASAEAQLLALEQIALYQPRDFATALSGVEEACAGIHLPKDRFEVSIIEDEQRQEFFHGKQTRNYENVKALANKLATGLRESRDANPSFWTAPKGAAAAQPAAPAAEDALSPPDKALLVWHLYATCSRSEDRAVAEHIFRRDRLESALAYAGQSEPNRLEMLVLHRLASDIDWLNRDFNEQQRAVACAQAVTLFQRLQQLASHPEPEISWWQRELLPPIEQRYLRGFDRLLASQLSDAMFEFDAVDQQLASIEPQLNRLANSIAAAQRALHDTPHLLAWLLKEHRFAAEQDLSQINAMLVELGQVDNLCQQFYRQLQQPPTLNINESMLQLGDELELKLGRLERAFRDYVEQFTNFREAAAAGGIAQTFRRERIALLSPLIPLESRRKLHENTLSFLSEELEENLDQSTTSTPAQRPMADAVASYLSSISDEPKWMRLVRGDLRDDLLDQFTAFEKPASNSESDLRSELMQIEIWQRAYALSFGCFPSLQRRVRTVETGDVAWPWAAAWQRWSLSSAHQRLTQVQRLAEAGWGNGTIQDTWSTEEFFFGRLAKNYAVANNLNALDPIGAMADSYQSRMQAALEGKAASLKSLHTKINQPSVASTAGDSVEATVEIEGDALKAVAEVYMGKPAKRIAWRETEPQKRSWPVDLASDARSSTQDIGLEHWDNGSLRPLTTLALRGNYRSEPIPWSPPPPDKPPLRLTLQREAYDRTTLQVLPPTEPPPLTVLILIDCSKSMETEVQPKREAGEEKKKLFEIVKDNVRQVIKDLAQRHNQREANIRLALIPFGLKRSAVPPQLEQFLIMRPGDFYRSRGLKPLEPGWTSDVEVAIDQLVASGETPLYDAIQFACETALEVSQNETQVYVFSDGVNYIPKEDGISISIQKVQEAVQKNPKLRLSIFHYDYFNEWVAGPGKEDAEFWKRKYAEGIEELKGLRTKLGDQYRYYSDDQATQLLEDSLAVIPRSTFKVASMNNSSGRPAFESDEIPLGRLIPIDAEYIPTDLKIDVTGPFQPAFQEVAVDGGEKLQLQFNPGIDRLQFPKFMEDGKAKSQTREGSNLRSELFLRILYGRLDADQLGFDLYFRNRTESEFTRRPRLIVAEVSQPERLRADTFVLADHAFKPGTHFPQARLSDFPWLDPGQPARVRVWAAETWPVSESHISKRVIEPGKPDQMNFANGAELRLGKQAGMVVATVTYQKTPPLPRDRIVVICPDFEKSNRTFQQRSYQERHEFTLPESLVDMPTEVYVSTIRDLELAAAAGDVTQFEFNRLVPGN